MPDFKVTEADRGKRIDTFVTKALGHYTRASLKSLFETGAVRVNQDTARPGYKLRPADVVSVDKAILQIRQAAPDLPVIYEDKDVVVINKPVGLLTHSKGAINSEPTVASFINAKITDKNMAGNRAGIVHRLDRGTSGVIICAKTAHSLKFLQKQFSNRSVEKKYVAMVHGHVSPPEAVIDVPIERNPKRPQTFRTGSLGKPAMTHYRLLKTLKKGGEVYSLIELKPKTGRTHQLRVHLSYIGHPIVGDRVYGRDGNLPMMLHAASLKLKLPSGAMKMFNAPTPDSFISVTKELIP